MKKLILGAAAAAMTLTTFVASAASARDYNGYDGYRSRSYAVRSYDGDRYRQAYRGWDRNRVAYRGYDHRDHDRGDTAGAAILGGVVGLMLGAALADHNSQPTYSYGYSQPTYNYGYGYGYQPYGGYSGYGY